MSCDIKSMFFFKNSQICECFHYIFKNVPIKRNLFWTFMLFIFVIFLYLLTFCHKSRLSIFIYYRNSMNHPVQHNISPSWLYLCRKKNSVCSKSIPKSSFCYNILETRYKNLIRSSIIGVLCLCVKKGKLGFSGTSNYCSADWWHFVKLVAWTSITMYG